MEQNSSRPKGPPPRSIFSSRDPDGNFSDSEVQIIRRRLLIMRVYASIYIVAMFGQCLLPAPVSMASVIAMMVAPIFVFMLAVQIHGGVIGSLLTFLSMGPVIGLLMILLINMQAMDVIKRHDKQRAATLKAAQAAKNDSQS